MSPWEISHKGGGFLVAFPVHITVNRDEAAVPAWSAQLRNPLPLTGKTVTQVRLTAAQAAWAKIQHGVLPVHAEEVTAVRLLTTVSTLHRRPGEFTGPAVQVPAVADRIEPHVWAAATPPTAGLLAGHLCKGPTLAGARESLVEQLMLELEVNPQGVAHNWRAIRLHLVSRKTFPVSALG